MRHRNLLLAAQFAYALATPMATQAQCLECAQQMLSATLTANAWYNINQGQIDEIKWRDAHNGICYDANRHWGKCGGKAASTKDRFDSKIPDWTAGEARKILLDVLKAGYVSRQRSQGKGQASQWLNTAAGDIGRQMAALEPEYFRRWDASDRNPADQWYLGQVRQIAERYVNGYQGPGQGEAMIGQVPSATRQRASDATFAVLEPLLKRIEKSQGQASALAWAREMGTAVGSGVKNLAPEYAQRAKVEGQTSADRWYVDQATRLARLQAASDR